MIYGPKTKTYKLFETCMVGGQFNAFTRYEEVGITKVRPQKYEDAKLF